MEVGHQRAIVEALEAQTAKLAPIDFLSALVQDELLCRQDWIS